MVSKENIKYSLKNLIERKSRSFLTILSIFIGIMTIFIFVSFGLGLFTYIEEVAASSSADKFTVEGKGFGAPGTSSVALTDDELETIEKTRGVIDAEGAYFKGVEVKQGKIRKIVYMVSVDPDVGLINELLTVDVEKGRELRSGDTNKVVLGYNYQLDDKIFPKGLKVNDKIEINGENYRIVGFFESLGNPGDDSNVYLEKEAFEKLFPSETYTWIIGRANIDEMDVVVNRVRKEVRDLRGEEEGKEEFNVASFEDQIAAFSAALNIVIAFIIIIALISVVVSAVNTTNTMVTSVLERIKEIGIIKSIGAKNSEIFNIFLFESAFLGFVAGIIGVVLGWLISAGAGSALDALGWGFLAPYFSFSLFFWSVLFATVVGAVSGVIPAVRASRLKPVDALRYE